MALLEDYFIFELYDLIILNYKTIYIYMLTYITKDYYLSSGKMLIMTEI
jgi:hypothetical protein